MCIGKETRSMTGGEIELPTQEGLFMVGGKSWNRAQKTRVQQAFGCNSVNLNTYQYL
jgi:hypothetical protein